ncbi:uncharacterized protein LOC123549788 [Mercenaria mercenaria]|uniref:uncharacterized protein LOC123549788 n=1 Tax=Mercenaria mercenaria TaxID=6596 RepID=UPI00234E79EE|nr:uncharacterized protein LOC123549788 [Mercenaria mercenaria]
MQTEGEKTPEKITSVAKPTISTPLEDQPPVLSMLPDVSDISEGSESDIDIMERYMKRAKEADNSFIEISLDYGTEDDKDSTYIPETSDEEESCNDDLSEYEDFDLDMSLLLENTMQNLEEVPIQGSEERESYVESDESDYEVETDEEDSSDYERNVVTERKIICFEENIKQLAQMLRVQYTTRNCTSAVSIQQSLKGTAMELKWIQGKHSVPVISEQFSDMVQRNRLKYAGQTITIAGDGRMDSPGHSAQYCTYTMLENQSKDIISMEIVEKRMTALKSTRMEIEGLKRAIIGIQEANISVGEVVTDASTTIAAMLRKDHPKVTHSFDTWHGAKNFGKRIGTVAAEKKNKDLRPWVSDLVNYFWFCSRSASGDESKLLSSWRGILHHVVNVHQWGLGDGAGQAQCQHGDLDDHVEPKWLEPGSDAHHSLTRVILDTGLLHSLKHYVNFRHTGELENFHDALLMYCAKIRIQLSSIQGPEHVGSP